MTQAWGTPSQPKTIMITTCSSVGGRRIKRTKHSVIHLHLNESVVNFQNLAWNIQLFMHHVCHCNQRVTLRGQFLPDRLISSSVSLSRLPALFTMFIKWMAVQANGIRYRPRRWQNCSDWLRSFSSFSLFWKWRGKKTNLSDSMCGQHKSVTRIDFALQTGMCKLSKTQKKNSFFPPRRLQLPYLCSIWLFHHHIGLSTFSNITLLQYFFQLGTQHKPLLPQKLIQVFSLVRYY